MKTRMHPWGVRLFHLLIVLLLFGGGWPVLPQSVAEASANSQPQYSGRKMCARDAWLLQRLAEAWQDVPMQTGETEQVGSGGQTPPASPPPQTRDIKLPSQSPSAPAVTAPTPSGATSPVPLNHTFDAPSVDIPSLISNWDFEQDAYTVGPVGDGGRAPNYDFETGDLSNWGSVGTASVKSGGPTGYYAELGYNG